MKKHIALLIVYSFLFSGNAYASSFQYTHTIQLIVTDIEGVSSYGDNVFIVEGAWPDRVIVTDLNGIITNIFPTSGAFTAGITFNPKNNRILFSGGNNYTGDIYEINPENGVISGPVAQAGYSQPYLAYDGSSILASSEASGSNGILTISIKKIDALTYNNLIPISVTVNTGTSASGVGRSVIACDNGYLYVALGISGLQDVYEFDGNLNLVQTIKITQIGGSQSIQGLTFVNNDLYVQNGSTNEFYHYARISSPVISTGGGGGGGGCSLTNGRVNINISAAVSMLLLFIPIVCFWIHKKYLVVFK
jgi:hypothetical protein